MYNRPYTTTYTTTNTRKWKKRLQNGLQNKPLLAVKMDDNEMEQQKEQRNNDDIDNVVQQKGLEFALFKTLTNTLTNNKNDNNNKQSTTPTTTTTTTTTTNEQSSLSTASDLLKKYGAGKDTQKHIFVQLSMEKSHENIHIPPWPPTHPPTPSLPYPISAYLLTSIPLSLLSFTLCYLLVSSGFDVPSLLSSLGLPVTETSENIGNTAIAYAAHKALSPVRFPPTVALTPVVAKWMGRKEEEL
jgi:hypothetical protein